MRIKYFARDKNMRRNCHANQVVGVTKVPLDSAERLFKNRSLGSRNFVDVVNERGSFAPCAWSCNSLQNMIHKNTIHRKQ